MRSHTRSRAFEAAAASGPLLAFSDTAHRIPLPLREGEGGGVCARQRAKSRVCRRRHDGFSRRQGHHLGPQAIGGRGAKCRWTIHARLPARNPSPFPLPQGEGKKKVQHRYGAPSMTSASPRLRAQTSFCARRRLRLSLHACPRDHPSLRPSAG
jgi:hypothetical protein